MIHRAFHSVTSSSRSRTCVCVRDPASADAAMGAEISHHVHERGALWSVTGHVTGRVEARQADVPRRDIPQLPQRRLLESPRPRCPWLGVPTLTAHVRFRGSATIILPPARLYRDLLRLARARATHRLRAGIRRMRSSGPWLSAIRDRTQRSEARQWPRRISIADGPTVSASDCTGSKPSSRRCSSKSRSLRRRTRNGPTSCCRWRSNS